MEPFFLFFEELFLSFLRLSFLELLYGLITPLADFRVESILDFIVASWLAFDAPDFLIEELRLRSDLTDFRC